MPAFFTTALIVVVGVVSVLIFGVWGFPVVLLALLAGGIYLVAARRNHSSIGVVERGRKVEPTGKPRSAHGGDTANERVGQV